MPRPASESCTLRVHTHKNSNTRARLTGCRSKFGDAFRTVRVERTRSTKLGRPFRLISHAVPIRGAHHAIVWVPRGFTHNRSLTPILIERSGMSYASCTMGGQFSANGLLPKQGSHMACPAREISHKEIESEKTSQALKQFFQRERQSQKDRASIWFVSAGMLAVLLILVLLLIQVSFSRPKNRNPTESTWYHAIPSFTILTAGSPDSVLPSTCPTAISLLP